MQLAGDASDGILGRKDKIDLGNNDGLIQNDGDRNGVYHLGFEHDAAVVTGAGVSVAYVERSGLTVDNTCNKLERNRIITADDYG